MHSRLYNFDMKKYLSYYSAVTFWNIPYIEVVLGSEIDRVDRIDMTVSERKIRSSEANQKIRLCELELPPGAVVSRNGTTVASPELLFLQLALELSIHRLILLGLQLCSYPPGNSSVAITTKEKLETFLAKTLGHRGHRKALRASKYIEDGSASIMESIVYMILTLPNVLGGYGLDGAVFNHEIKLKEEGGNRLGQKRCFTDLYYKSAKLAVEYESFAFHNSPWDQGKDMVRAATLERQGIDVMRLSTVQLYNKNSCKDFAFNLARRFGKRIQIRTDKFDQMHTQLRALMPTAEPVDRPEVGEGTT